MKTAILLGFAGLLTATAAQADQYVNSYFRSDGTFVQGYYRSSPDSSYNNNWSVQPNYNPYTLKQGTLTPTYNDQAPCPKWSAFCN